MTPSQPASAEDVAWARDIADRCTLGLDASKRLQRLADAAEAGLWRPIESAPKGGGAELVTDPNWVNPPRILLRFGDETVSVAYWDWYYAEGGAGFRDGFAWIEPCSGEPLNLYYSTPPTHWLPLPKVPHAD